MQMKLLIDIGNTNTSLAIAENKRIKKRYFIHTDKKRVSSLSLKRLLGKDLSKIEKVIVVSVVPKFLLIVKKSLKTILPKVKILVVGKDILVPMKVNYTRPEDVGEDRLVTSFSAMKRCGLPVASIDFGTAVTFDFVNKKGEYDGGLIFPGIRLGLSSLFQNTALLPKVDIEPTKSLVGRSTRSSMNNGVIFGYAAMCDGIIERAKKKYGKRLKIVATGGDAELIAKYSRCIKLIKPDLIFTGLMELS